jgi:hypothetical protein
MIPSSFTFFPGPLAILKWLLPKKKDKEPGELFHSFQPSHLAQLRYDGGEQIQLEDGEIMAVFLRDFHLLLCPPGWTANKIGLDVTLTTTSFKGNVILDNQNFVGDTLYFEYIKTNGNWSLQKWTLSTYAKGHNHGFPKTLDASFVPRLDDLAEKALAQLSVKTAQFGIWTRPIFVKSAHEKIKLLKQF